ncbi:tRNA threonylcarbamoyladenosine biosynthesis protein TsaE [Oxobacter pfennigii]|uniref:tRNA threonylcarbamoyladenosine biosynthesis protein TsaE n=1 Tax=Oxobacter pfennigii TaxID=36849 RepID=A0A0P8W6I2_9CLOT|nr:tRNA (adenosine(37)-N6)-threonylcarbamoyltransferase complex ATPase subunit type 1 TsaE [Oxobacter pfennigii]KPU43623.1 tRNA threonylcarbamoyladenosine biosynthesis protein TsaE [Oxobacter pfennigii]
MLFESYSPNDTEKVGEYLGSIANKGYVICLTGDLGAGKTKFVKGLAKGLNIDDYITSPTFTIVNEYNGRLPLYHFDVYRINDTDEMHEIGFDEYIYGQGVSVIEWANIIEEILPKENIWVDISKDMEVGEDYRKIQIKVNGEKYQGLIWEMIEKCEF